MGRCQSCGFDNPGGGMHCANCGADMPTTFARALDDALQPSLPPNFGFPAAPPASPAAFSPYAPNAPAPNPYAPSAPAPNPYAPADSPAGAGATICRTCGASAQISWLTCQRCGSSLANPAALPAPLNPAKYAPVVYLAIAACVACVAAAIYMGSWLPLVGAGAAAVVAISVGTVMVHRACGTPFSYTLFKTVFWVPFALPFPFFGFGPLLASIGLLRGKFGAATITSNGNVTSYPAIDIGSAGVPLGIFYLLIGLSSAGAGLLFTTGGMSFSSFQSFSSLDSLFACKPGKDCICDGNGDCSKKCSRRKQAVYPPTPNCEMDCKQNANCNFSCDEGGCTVNADGNRNAKLDCEDGYCKMKCDGNKNCDVRCRDGHCAIWADGNGSAKLDCPGGTCTMECGGNKSCEITECKSGCSCKATDLATCKGASAPSEAAAGALKNTGDSNRAR